MAAAALLRRHIRHCSLNMTFLCLQVDGVVTDVASPSALRHSGGRAPFVGCRCAAPSRHIRHRSLNMTFLCLQVDGVVTDVEIFPVRLLLLPGRRRKMHVCRPGHISLRLGVCSESPIVLPAVEGATFLTFAGRFASLFWLSRRIFSHFPHFSHVLCMPKQIGCYLARR